MRISKQEFCRLEALRSDARTVHGLELSPAWSDFPSEGRILTAAKSEDHEQARKQEHLQAHQPEASGERGVPLQKKRRVGGRARPAATLPSTSIPQQDHLGLSEGLSKNGGLEIHDEGGGMEEEVLAQGFSKEDKYMELYDNGGGAVQGWAPPGLGVCQLWAQQASSLKFKKTSSIGGGVSASFLSSPSVPSSAGSSPPTFPSLAAKRGSVVGFGIDDAVPVSREDKAKLVGGYLGSARPGYGDKSRKPVWWAAEVPWLKGVSISQMNNATLHKLVLAVKAHQRQERRQALASGANFVPDGGILVCTPKTKKEMSRLIRSIQGRRLQYGKDGKCPPWWPTSAPWDSDRPLSTMKHGEVTSIFKAMVREGLLCDTDSAGSSSPSSSSFSPSSSDTDTGRDDRCEDYGHHYEKVTFHGKYKNANYEGEIISDEDSQRHSSNIIRNGDSSGGSSTLLYHRRCDSSSRSSASRSFWGDDVEKEVGQMVSRGSFHAMMEQPKHLTPPVLSFPQQQQQQQQQQRAVVGETAPHVLSPVDNVEGGEMGVWVDLW